MSSLFTPRSTLSGRELQLRLDTAQLYLSIPSRLRAPPHGYPETPEQAHVASILNVGSLPPFADQAAVVTAYLTATCRTQLVALSSALRSNTSVEDHLRERLSFVPSVCDSAVRGAGRGVYISGTASRGSLVTLYPGVSYLPSQVRQLGVSSGNDYWISRFDGVIIDGAAQVELEVSLDVAREQELVHPLALGHLINHPPEAEKANCLQFMLDVDIRKLPDGARELVPNANFGEEGSMLERIENQAYRQRVPGSARFVSKTKDMRRVRRTLALVAMRDITDEEVFMNYRFNPDTPGVPDWYHDCDPEGSRRRWNTKGVFF